MLYIFLQALAILLLAAEMLSWKAIPANHAMYALRQQATGMIDPTYDRTTPTPDEQLPRNHLHSTYKFGWCTKESLQDNFRRRTANYSVESFKDSTMTYLYLLQKSHTMRFALQCIVMSTWVPRKYYLRRGRLPLYYCQGHIVYVIKNTIHKMQIHEFYFHNRLSMPATFIWEFYHPRRL